MSSCFLLPRDENGSWQNFQTETEKSDWGTVCQGVSHQEKRRNWNLKQIQYFFGTFQRKLQNVTQHVFILVCKIRELCFWLSVLSGEKSHFSKLRHVWTYHKAWSLRFQCIQAQFDPSNACIKLCPPWWRIGLVGGTRDADWRRAFLPYLHCCYLREHIQHACRCLHAALLSRLHALNKRRSFFYRHNESLA